MAESIFVTLDSMNTETSVPAMGKDQDNKTIMVNHSLPRELFPTSSQFESADQLIEWSNDNGFTHAILQRGIQKFLIEARATFKGSKKDQTWTEDLGQTNVDKMEWKAIQRPNQSSNKNIAKTLLKENLATYQMMIDVANMTEDQITPVLLEKYNNAQEVVTSILDALNFK